MTTITADDLARYGLVIPERTVKFPRTEDYSEFATYLADPTKSRSSLRYGIGHISRKEAAAANKQAVITYEHTCEYLKRECAKADDAVACKATAEAAAKARRVYKEYAQAGPVETVACDTTTCFEHDNFLSVEHLHPLTGHLVISDVEIPSLTQEQQDDVIDRFATVPDSLASYVSSPVYTNTDDPNGEFGNHYVDQMYVDNQQFGVESAPDYSILQEMLPTFRIQHGNTPATAGNVRGVCACGYSLTYSDVCKRRGVLIEDPAVNMQAFTAMLAAHANDVHEGVTVEDMCKHGLRNFVKSKSRSTGQAFAASFCSGKGLKQADQCAPVWHNDLSL